MPVTNKLKFCWAIILPLAILVLTGCQSMAPDIAYYRGQANQHLQTVQTIQDLEKENADLATEQYQEFLETAPSLRPFSEYQVELQDSIRVLQQSPSRGGLHDEAALGFPDNYQRQLEAQVKTHQGLARVHLAKGNVGEAEKAIDQSLHLCNEFGITPESTSQSLLVSYRLLTAIQERQGQRGKALIAKLNADLTTDHINSEVGLENFYVEKQFLHGKGAEEAFYQAQGFMEGINKYRRQQNQATMMAVTGGVMQANAAFQTSMANQAMAKSGGVMTPQVQMAQSNAQMAQFQAQMFTVMAQQAAGQTENLNMSTTPWALPNFGQQMVDPRMGVNPDGIIKGFAGDATKVSQTPSLQTQAQEVTQQVDALAALRQAGGNDAKMQQLSKFADAFNNFLTLVQEIK